MELGPSSKHVSMLIMHNTEEPSETTRLSEECQASADHLFLGQLARSAPPRKKSRASHLQRTASPETRRGGRNYGSEPASRTAVRTHEAKKRTEGTIQAQQGSAEPAYVLDVKVFRVWRRGGDSVHAASHAKCLNCKQFKDLGDFR